MRAVLPRQIAVPRTLALMLLAVAVVAVSLLIILARTSPGGSLNRAVVPPANVSTMAPTSADANDSSPVFGLQP